MEGGGGTSSGDGRPQQSSSSSSQPPPPPPWVTAGSSVPAAAGPGPGAIDTALEAEDARWRAGQAVPLKDRVD
eukprot:3011207-Alexandrium_andersonii.AAC.1